MKKILPCHLHDFIEIACLYGFEIQLRLKNNDVVQGNALTTNIASNKTEYLMVLVSDQNVRVDLTDIKFMRAVTRNPHFDLIEFDTESN